MILKRVRALDHGLSRLRCSRLWRRSSTSRSRPGGSPRPTAAASPRSAAGGSGAGSTRARHFPLKESWCCPSCRSLFFCLFASVGTPWDVCSSLFSASAGIDTPKTGGGQNGATTFLPSTQSERVETRGIASAPNFCTAGPRRRARRTRRASRAGSWRARRCTSASPVCSSSSAREVRARARPAPLELRSSKCTCLHYTPCSTKV